MSFKRNLIISFGRTAAAFVLQFISNIVLARLLLPSEIGVFSVAMATIVIVHALRDFGIGRYLIQEKDLTDEKVRTVFGSAIVIGWSLAAIIFFSRHLVAQFYGQPILSNILALLSINFLLLPFGQPALSLMRRDQQYGRAATVQLGASVVSTAVSILFAALGSGPYALAYGAVANSVTAAAWALAYRPDHILLRPGFKEWRTVWKFGFISSGTNFIVQLGVSAPDLVIGRLLTFTAVGLFSRGSGLAKMFEQFFVNALAWIMGAELGAIHREGKSLAYLTTRSTDLTVVIGWPFLAFLAIKAHAIVWILYGDQWLGAVPVLQAISIARMIQLLVSGSSAIYEGTGAIRLEMRNEIILQIFSISLLFLGSLYSIEAVAWLRVLLSALVVVVHWSVMRSYGHIRIKDFAAALWKSATVSVVFVLALLAVSSVVPTYDNPWKELFVLLGEGMVAGLVYVGALAVIKHSLYFTVLGGVRGALASFRGRRDVLG